MSYDLVLGAAVLVSSFLRGQGHEQLVEMAAAMWVLIGKETVPRLRLGQLCPGYRMRCGGGEAKEGIRKLPQIAWPAARCGRQAPVGAGGKPASWPMGLDLGKLGKGQK